MCGRRTETTTSEVLTAGAAQQPSPAPRGAGCGSTADGVDLSLLEFEKQAVSCAFSTLLLMKNLTF